MNHPRFFYETTRKAEIAARVLAIFVALSFFDRAQALIAAPGDTSNPATYAYGTVISFAKGGNSESFRTSGWSAAEEKFIWTEGQAATLVMRVAATADQIELKMKLAGMVKKPDLSVQPVEVYINNKKVAEWQVENTAQFTAAVPLEVTKAGGSVTIMLKTPKAIAPKALGLGADERVLGVSCLEFELSKTT